MKWSILPVLAILFLAPYAAADGKMYIGEGIPPSIPYQRAIILFRDGSQTLILQSRYALAEDSAPAALGWVVPVPAEPEIAAMDAEDAHFTLRLLALRSRPHIIRISLLITYLLFTVSVACLLLFLVSMIPVNAPPFRWLRRIPKPLLGTSLIAAIVLLLLAINIPSLGIPIEILEEQQVGIYDVRVIRSADSSALIAWLDSNGFAFDDSDTRTFESYIARGWCFVVATVNPSADLDSPATLYEGLAAPLKLRFPAENPIYPLMLTGTAGHDTKVLIYLASDYFMTTDRLPMLYAGYAMDPLDGMVFTSAPTLDIRYYPCLQKFRGTLTPQQMQDDITFSPAPDMKPYRQKIVRW